MVHVYNASILEAEAWDWQLCNLTTYWDLLVRKITDYLFPVMGCIKMTPKSHIFEYLILGWWSYCRRIRKCNLVGKGLPLGFFPCLFFFFTVLDILSQMWDLRYCSRIMSVCLLLPQPWWSFLWNLKPQTNSFFYESIWSWCVIEK